MEGRTTIDLSIGITPLDRGSESDRRRRLGALLREKRASIDPASLALPNFRRRRIRGLRREEVASLAGISVAWYTQLESGASITVSTSVLARVADVLRLDTRERVYLFSLGIEEMAFFERAFPELAPRSGRIEAETFSQEIALVLRAHRALKTQIYAGLLNRRIDDLAPCLDESRCPIGLWLHDDLAPALRATPGYARAARIHAAFHREIERVVSTASTGRAAEIESLLAITGRYAVASQALERTFARWPTEIAG